MTKQYSKETTSRSASAKHNIPRRLVPLMESLGKLSSVRRVSHGPWTHGKARVLSPHLIPKGYLAESRSYVFGARVDQIKMKLMVQVHRGRQKDFCQEVVPFLQGYWA